MDYKAYDPIHKRHKALQERIDNDDDIGRIIMDLRMKRACEVKHRGSIKNDIKWLQDIYYFDGV